LGSDGLYIIILLKQLHFQLNAMRPQLPTQLFGAYRQAGHFIPSLMGFQGSLYSLSSLAGIFLQVKTLTSHANSRLVISDLKRLPLTQ
jgi:hypothetical protein